MTAEERWELTAPESYALLNGQRANGREAFRLGVMELVARRALVLEEPGKNATVRDGPRAGSPREWALGAIWGVYQATPSHSWAGRHGTRLKDLAREAVKRYGSLNGYLKLDVFQALIERGLMERREGRFLFIFPTTRFEHTDKGLRAKADLERVIETGNNQFSGWAAHQPNQALAYATMAGAAMLLMPSLYPDFLMLEEQRRRATDDGGAGFTPTTADGGSDEPGEVDGGGFDLGGFDFGGLDFGGLDVGSFDFGSDGGFGGGDGGGFGGDGGGGGGGDGGGGGGE